MNSSPFPNNFITFVRMTYNELWHQLVPLYEPEEARAVVRELLDKLFGMTLTDIVSGKVDELTAEDQALLEGKMQRLRRGEPVQYVTGVEYFAGRPFSVGPSVLIPRPETEQLCELIRQDYDRPYCALQPPEPMRVLDIGTGSGCIAITLALDLPNTVVTAWDISPDALLTARENAHRLGADINFQLHDILDGQSLPEPDQQEKFELIVSNPPYICDSERKAIAHNVLDYEPSMALFVPDDDPLRFYRAIGHYARVALKSGGRLYFEVNARYADDVAALLRSLSFSKTEVRKDYYGKNRFVIAEINRINVNVAT